VRVQEAKDFLVQQTAEQAQLEGVPFSDLERRMMYFTEIEEKPEDPIQLNQEFEAEYDSDEYEAKISKLLHHAQARNKKKNPEAARQWNQAIKVLNKGDHYLWVLWSENSPSERPPYDSLEMLGTALGMIALVLLGVFVSGKLEPQRRWLQKNIPRPNPPSPVRSLCSIYSGRFLISTCPRKRPELVSGQDVVTLSRTPER
jgi:hypothetical protein